MRHDHLLHLPVDDANYDRAVATAFDRYAISITPPDHTMPVAVREPITAYTWRGCARADGDM